MAAPTEKLKILCLHGYRQNAAVFRTKTGAFRSAMKKYAEFVIVDAPHIVSKIEVDSSEDDDTERAWWLHEDPGAPEDLGLSLSVAYIKEILVSQGPFHGILGFSQGAAFAVVISNEISKKELSFPGEVDLSFLILVAGFNSKNLPMRAVPGNITTKTLLVIGEEDKIIPKEMSEDLVPYFTDIEVMYHPGGHGIPLRSNQKKFFILCLHGYRQNGKGFREKIGSFRKPLKKYAEFYFCDAPHKVCEEQGGGDDQSLGWWFSREDNYYKAVQLSDIDKGFQQSVEEIKKVFEEQGPFDGVVAFSQGACFLAMLCALQETEELDLGIKFVMLFAGFRSRCSPHDKYFNESNPIRIPALLCIGEGDDVIPYDMGKDLVKYFKDPVVLEHPGGHFVPNGPEQKKAYVDFLANQIARKAAS